MTIDEAKSHLSSYDLIMSDESRAAVDVLLEACEAREALVKAAMAWRDSMTKYHRVPFQVPQNRALFDAIATLPGTETTAP